ncbi:MAG: NAD-dependent epimerase/dehydratase family protein [Deltaproteobacteria bacterium]
MDSIVIAGATGFVGHAVAQRLAQRFEVTGLTRGRRDARGAWTKLVTCDLFSQQDVERAFAGARYVVYLVHSMLPSARLVQGAFSDLDLICADNVGRVAAKLGVEQIVYLGGLIPADDVEISEHLRSRREVEAALGAHGVNVTTLRAGIVIGPHGSSFEIMTRLVKRLPAMVLPSWTEHLCQPIDLGTVAAAVDHVTGRTTAYGETYDLGGPDALRYRDMLAVVGDELGVHRRTLRVPFVSPRISRLWVSTITGAPRSLVKPLVESLRHDMVCRDRRLQDEANLPGLPFREAVRAALAAESGASKKPQAYAPAPPAPVAGVRSVQRIALPPERDAEWAAHEYMRWLPRGAWPMRVAVDSDHRLTRFFLRPFRRPLLELEFADDRSASDLQLFYVTGGSLARANTRGRLEFRVTPDGAHLLTAIHDFMPALPWWLYRISQALVHRYVMWRFGRHLRRASISPPRQKPRSAASRRRSRPSVST